MPEPVLLAFDDVPRETSVKLKLFEELLRAENTRQNLVSASSLDQLWLRHFSDSAQLIRFAPPDARSWIDLGTGAGFPGLIVALLWPGRVTLVEERRLRHEFLERAVGELGLSDRVHVQGAKAERVPQLPYDVISARAFAPLPKLLDLAAGFSTEKTVWILPKGRQAKAELEAVRETWQGEFQLEPSVTDVDATVIVARGVTRLGRKEKA